MGVREPKTFHQPSYTHWFDWAFWVYELPSLDRAMDVPLSSRIPWLLCGRTGWRVVVLRDFLSIERGLFRINVTSCVESVPARVRWTGGYQISANRCIRYGTEVFCPPPSFTLYCSNYLGFLAICFTKIIPQLLRERIPVTPANRGFYVGPRVHQNPHNVLW
jgi:hypothetical protein